MAALTPGRADDQRLRRQADALAAVGRLLARTLDPEAVGQQIADSVRLLGVTSAIFYRVSATSGHLVIMAVSGDVGPEFKRGVVVTRGTGTVGLAVETRAPAITSDVLDDPRIRTEPALRAKIAAAPYRAVMAVPLVVHGRVVGVFALGDRPGRRFDAAGVALAEAFADQAGVALENRRPEAPPFARSTDLRGVRVLVVDDEADTRANPHCGAGGRLGGVGRGSVRRRSPYAAGRDRRGHRHAGRGRLRADATAAGAGDAAARRLPALALTAYARDEDRARALEAGFQMHVAKPIDPTRLTAAVAALLRNAA